ncbi:MAG: aspartate 1-decarboxylase [Gammaproteobacteria bacterium]|nr:MAG: aspartate 1-decarboxylase [Gammaproteobacteria bacterium]RLA14270.1 MAG: aspartate 1-decarboxylase [Gammaproteobacteria bacterium]
MLTTMLKTKIHRASVTMVELDYEGSCAIDDNLLDASGIREYEQIQIYNINNGQRFTTYAIRAARGSRTISINGAAAHLANVGDKIIICAFAGLDSGELATFKPKLIYVDDANNISHTNQEIPVQVA